MEKEIRDHVFTSGEAALNYLKKNLLTLLFFILALLEILIYLKILKIINLDSIEKSDYLLCTGLFDDHDKDLKYYKEFI